jgi:RNA polymerase sigma-70 factor (ECF subfamily)
MTDPPDEPDRAAGPVTESSLVLLDRARAGDRAALERLLARYLPVLTRWSRGRLPVWARDIVDTQDLVQDALMNTVTHLCGFIPQHEGALRAYLRQAVRHRIRDEIRRTRRRPGRAELDERQAAGEPSPFEELVGTEAALRYEAALRQLRPADRDLIVARVELGLSYDEIAKQTGRPSAAAAQMAASRALVRLAQAMGPRTSGPGRS